ncbi:MAG: phage integrase N-terminal SAM-like domain-containing protein [Deltaproteobacteria bacterium]|nr:phage integrase N-terminal SAM-like domain-containing protein [Deltaproteobacteria bacterium]
MGELRDRMVRDMDVRHFPALQRLPADVSERTVEANVAGVKGLAKYFMQSPDQFSDAQVQRYLLHLRQERQLSGSTCNQIRCALKFFYEVTVRRPQPSLTVPPMRQAQKLPQIPSAGWRPQPNCGTQGGARLRARSGAADGIGALRAPERARRSRSTERQHGQENTKSSRAATISGSSSSVGRKSSASSGRRARCASGCC